MTTIPCYVCGHSEMQTVINTQPSMSSDGQIVDFKITKEECLFCGTVRTQDISFLNNFYRNHYQLNVANLDPIYVFQGQQMPKSEMHLEWLYQLAGDKIKKAKNVLEIGCGSGNLLDLFPQEDKYGVEPSAEAAAFAAKIAKVRNIGYEGIEEQEKYDLIISSCVIEHTVDPNHFLQKNWQIASDESTIIVGLPIQDTESFDVYFLDHLHHFTSRQFIYLCEKNGFIVVDYAVGYKSMTGMGYFILKKGKAPLQTLHYEKNNNFQQSSLWLANINAFIEKHHKQAPIYAFGYGETSFFYQTYSKINSVVTYYIDDVRANSNEKVISTTQAIEDEKLENSCLILLANPCYHDYLISKFNSVRTVIFYSPFSNTIIENK